MATFAYEALNEKGKTQKGTVEAASAEEAQAKIKSDGYFPPSIREQKVKGKAAKAKSDGKAAPAKKKQSASVSLPWSKVKAMNMTLFTRQFSTRQDAGLPRLSYYELGLVLREDLPDPAAAAADHLRASFATKAMAA